MTYWLPDPRGSTGRAQSAYWADDDPEYVRRQQELGRDTSELKPEIRVEYEARVRAARMQAEAGTVGRILAAVFPSPDAGDLFGSHFTARRYPWWRRLALRLRGWE